MKVAVNRLRAIFERTDGRCHLCGVQLAFSNYSQHGERGAWEIEHSRCRAKGGSDRLCNLYAAHIRCNRSKGTVTTRTARLWKGRARAPLSKAGRAKQRVGRAVGLGLSGLLLTLAAPPWVRLAATAAGAVLGYKSRTD